MRLYLSCLSILLLSGCNNLVTTTTTKTRWVSDRSVMPAAFAESSCDRDAITFAKTSLEKYQGQAQEDICNILFSQETLSYVSRSGKVIEDDGRLRSLQLKQCLAAERDVLMARIRQSNEASRFSACMVEKGFREESYQDEESRFVLKLM